MDEYRLRVRLFAGLIIVVAAILGGRLAWLQLVETDIYTGESRSNALRERRVQPARGAIFDRDGTLMVDNSQTFTITITPRYFDEANIDLLADLLEVSDSAVVAQLERARARSRFQPHKAFREVSMDKFTRVLENRYRLPGVNYELEQKRRFLTAARAPHAIGYIREISENELAARRPYGYRQGDIIGKTGLEKRYEPYLRGQLGSEFRLVNIHGRDFAPYNEGREDRVPASGYNLHLTVDADVQALAESLFVNKRGGAVAIDPKTGGIIAMVSAPGYDPEIFTQSVDPETWNYLMTSPEKPMLNRATMNQFPPGSTWKPFMALMSLAEGNIDTTQTVTCRGGHPIGGGRFFTCMGVHGALDVRNAIKNSCNTFFFEMMYRTDVETFHRYATMFGFGRQAPLELAEQNPGIIADSAFVVREYRRETGQFKWPLEPGWLLSMGIGQGYVGVNPLQLARYMAAVANRGTLVTPHFVDYLQDPESGERFFPAIPATSEIPIKKEFFDVVRDGMRLVMEQGTGRLAQLENTAEGHITSGGKTGTAQNNRLGPNSKDDSVFIMFAPLDDPQIAIAVQVENAGYGGSAAAPIASLMAEQYLTGQIKDLNEATNIRLRRARMATSDRLPNTASSR